MEIDGSTLVVVGTALIAALLWLFMSGGNQDTKKADVAAAPTVTKKIKADLPVVKKSTAAAAVAMKESPRATPSAPAAQPAKVVEEDAPVVVEDGGKKKKKKNNKNKGGKGASAVAVPVAAPAPVEKEEEEEEEEEEDDVDSAEEVERRRRAAQEAEDARAAAKLAKEFEYANSAAAYMQQQQQEAAPAAAGAGDDWEVAGQGKKAKKGGNSKAGSDNAAAPAASKQSNVAKQQQAAAAPAITDAHMVLGLPAMQQAGSNAAPVAPITVEVNKPVKVESRKIGIIIGPKGATKIAIQVATNTEIRTPRLSPEEAEKNKKMYGHSDGTNLVDVEVIGSTEWEVNQAIRAVKDLATKGYCALLGGDNFSEGSISVHSTFLPELIGKGGSVLKTLQDHYSVKITVPQVARDTKMDCKVMVVGDRKDVKRAKECIKVLSKYHHTEITHPGMCHDEMELAEDVHGYVIGYKGSEIHHIQKNFKVAVHIPGPHSLHEHVLVVGEPDDVRRAVTYINKVVEKALEPKQSAEEIIATEAAAAVAVDAEEEVLEPWMESYIKKGGSSTLDFVIN